MDSRHNWSGKVMGERLWVRPLASTGGARRGEQLGSLPARWRERSTQLTDGLGAKPLVLYSADERSPFFSGIHCGEFVRRRSREGQDATDEGQPPAEEAGVECEEPIAAGGPGQSILAVAEEALRHTNETMSMSGTHSESEGTEEGS